MQGRFYVGQGGTCPPDSLDTPQIQKLADHFDVISQVSKCSKIQIFHGSAPDAAGGELHPVLGPSGIVSAGLRV